MDTDTHYKNRIGQRLTQILLTSFEEGFLQKEQISYLACVIREELEQAETSADIFRFVEILSEEWPIFSSVLSDPTKHIVKNVNRRYLEKLATK